jgi:hypothetical protein
MMGVAGLAVLGMTATLAGAQTVEVKEKAPLYRYVSYRTFPRAHWSDVDKNNATGNQKSSHLRSPTAPSSATATMRIRCTPLKASPTTAGGRLARSRA